ncbi:MAG TPA: VWA domain-containing protein [Microlunatus sp.]
MHLSAHLDLDVLAHETDDQLSVLVELTAPEQSRGADRAPSTLVVVLDRSGSMAGPRLEQAKAALTTVIDQLDPRDRFGLVTFDQHTTVAVPAGALTDKPSVKRAIAQVHPGGSTDLSGGYLRGLQEARRVAGGAGATVLVVSDGHANAGLTDPAQLGGLARGAGETDRITTSTLGMGLGYDERLLSAIASGGGGNEHFAETADEAGKLIAGEVDGLLALVAQAGSLRVRMAPPVRAVRVINDLSVGPLPDGIMIELGAFYAGETRKLIMTFDVPGIPALGLAEVATLELGYLTVPALEQQTVSLPLYVNVVPGDQAAGRIPDPVVRTEAAFQRAQQAKRAASTALSAGDSLAASAALRTARSELGRAVVAAPAQLVAELDDEIGLLDRLADEVTYGDVTRAAKLSSADATFKSRTRGRRR